MSEVSMNNNAGPNQIRPTENIRTSDPAGCVKIKIPETGTALETMDPISVPGLLYNTVQEFPNAVALAQKINGNWEKITYREYLAEVRTCAKAFISLGLERYHSVCILGFNSPEWFYSNLGAIFAGGFAAGVYTTNSAEACFYCAKSSRANIIVVQDDKQLQKIQEVRDNLPDLKAVIQYEGTPNVPGVLSWKEIMELGEKQTDEELEERLRNIAINDCCTLVYTSGTVGNPKAVMLSHDNLTYNSLSITERLNDLEKGKERIVSYLPLSHVAAQVIDIYLTIRAAAAVYFADKDALKGSLLNSLQEIQPTKFLAVPRVWEKIYEKMQEIGAKNTGIKKSIGNWAKYHGLMHYMDKLNGNNSCTWSYTLASVLIFKKIKQALGLGQCSLCASAAAPLSPEIKKYFLSIDIPVMEAFGMSEAGGAHTLCTIHNFGLETIGPTLPGMKTKLFDKNEEGHGEICMYGRHIFMGYMGEEAKTAEALDEEGWLHSGDLGKIDEKGLVYITGRLKELLITAGGENVAPVPIEQVLKAELPVLSNAMLIGDQKKFLSILLAFKTEMDPETGAPLDKLTSEAQNWCKSLGVTIETVTELLQSGPDPKIVQAIEEVKQRVNQKATSNAQRIQKFAILPADFSVPTGELGPTLKIRRNIVTKKYADLIEKLYS